MSTKSENNAVRDVAQSDDAVEALLGRASPRPRPPSEDERMIREAVTAEWQKVTGRRQTRNRLTYFAVAATVLLAVTASLNLLRVEGVAPTQVATIDKSHGAIYVLGEQSTQERLPETSVVMAGQTIKTDHDSGIGLAWGKGGSLRIAADTVIEFVAENEVYLHSGRIYFDSATSELSAAISGGSNSAELSIATDHGNVTHLGTQYMTYTASDRLEVSVREGEVAIDGKYHDEKAHAGQQLRFSGSARPSVLNIDAHGTAWSWVEETAPIANTDGRSIDDFLRWAGRETGRTVTYPDEATERAAQATILTGNVDLKPSEAMDFWLQGQDLKWHTDGGTITVITVSGIDGSSGQ